MIQHPGASAFLISKPLQLMVALCIVKQCRWDTKPLFIILNTFSDARAVAERLLHKFTQFQTPAFFSSRRAALSFFKDNKFSHLFIDSDVGVNNYMTLASLKRSNPQLLIHVLEEGLGTYRTDLYHGLKKKLLDLVGIGTSFGACHFVTSIYVFNKQEYIDKIPSNSLKVRIIHDELSKLLIENRDAFNQLFGFDEKFPQSKKDVHCSIYLSNWKIDNEFFSHFKRLNGDIYIKPHPQIQNLEEFEGVQLIGSNVPAELVLTALMENYGRVHVFDHQSSVRRYITGENLTFITATSYTAENTQNPIRSSKFRLC